MVCCLSCTWVGLLLVDDAWDSASVVNDERDSNGEECTLNDTVSILSTSVLQCSTIGLMGCNLCLEPYQSGIVEIVTLFATSQYFSLIHLH